MLNTHDLDSLLDEGFDPHWLIGQRVEWHDPDELLPVVIIKGSAHLQHEAQCQGLRGGYDCPETTTVYLGSGLHHGAWCYAYDEEGNYLANLRDQSYVCEQHERERATAPAAVQGDERGE